METAAFTAWPVPTHIADEGARNPLHWWQDGRCALCGRRARLVLDHDHTTGLERGYLCHSCNVWEGVAGEGTSPAIDAWRSGVTAAAALGVKRMYRNGQGLIPHRSRPATEAQMDALAEGIGALFTDSDLDKINRLTFGDGQQTVTES